LIRALIIELEIHANHLMTVISFESAYLT
jgi:hypothetical protein